MVDSIETFDYLIFVAFFSLLNVFLFTSFSSWLRGSDSLENILMLAFKSEQKYLTIYFQVTTIYCNVTKNKVLAIPFLFFCLKHNVRFVNKMRQIKLAMDIKAIS